jgi:hypothetical protein
VPKRRRFADGEEGKKTSGSGSEIGGIFLENKKRLVDCVYFGYRAHALLSLGMHAGRIGIAMPVPAQ